MKSVRIIRKDEAAVSPVIATILMVAITVVLAAVLYVMVSGLITGPGTTPRSMGATLVRSGDGSNWVLTVVQAPSGLTPANTKLQMNRADGTTNLTATAFSSLAIGTNGCSFADSGTIGTVDAADAVLCRTSWYVTGGTAQITDTTGIIWGPTRLA